ncbi:2-amino-4-hydroxy-6-hydroxymethyldihydropteridine diphosphokinase [Sphingobium sufflavum]|uniref:2-amino-4-hydroxy-6- hydroxymethyldihydropteridine diphosphokinase n=1 Tax=Sphingobium sufflavum TaxID=1129547 RepID=UPI001F3A054B|nr:2-amino-4-hydroxy-6-hydroxymethyldihydropteridine diphosphokinase [Sphingobium sufflavum]MCE7796837.1 2-amino-4-hydroxy-6-hydroxymethyldihydropteridine diphosphokinase [Sphingobium sufflavum]
MGHSGKQRLRKPKKQLYAIGIGSNQPLSRRLGPRAIVMAALLELDRKPLKVRALGPIIRSRPLGPSTRDYANSAAVIATRLSPAALLDHLQALEAQFGRRRRRRWGARTLDLDILLWEGGPVRSPRLAIPHPGLAARAFVLEPLRAIAPGWRDPASGLRIAHLAARNARARRTEHGKAG